MGKKPGTQQMLCRVPSVSSPRVIPSLSTYSGELNETREGRSRNWECSRFTTAAQSVGHSLVLAHPLHSQTRLFLTAFSSCWSRYLDSYQPNNSNRNIIIRHRKPGPVYV